MKPILVAWVGAVSRPMRPAMTVRNRPRVSLMSRKCGGVLLAPQEAEWGERKETGPDARDRRRTPAVSVCGVHQLSLHLCRESVHSALCHCRRCFECPTHRSYQFKLPVPPQRITLQLHNKMLEGYDPTGNLFDGPKWSFWIVSAIRL